MSMITRARGVLAAVRGAIVTPGDQAAAAPSGTLAQMIRQIVSAQKPPIVQPSLEAQRLTTVHSEPSVRTYTTWTPAMLKSALTMADGGNLSKAADLCDAILGDDRAPAVLNTRVNAVLGSPLTFEAGRGRSKKAVVKALEIGEDWYSAYDEAVLGQLLLWGRLLGVGLAQQNWRILPDHGNREIPVVENWHAQHLRWDPRERRWMVRVGDGGQEAAAAPGDGKWIIFTPYGANRPWAHGLWRGMSRLWLLKQYALDDFGTHSEAHGNPMRVGIPPKAGEANHGNKKLREELASDLADMASSSSIVLPPGFDFRLVEATANTFEMFVKQIDMANAGMSIMAIGSNLPTEVGNGAQTGATAQNLVRVDYKRADAEVLSTTTHDQTLTWWAEFNFAARGLAPWPEWEIEPKADLQARAVLVKTVADAIDKFGEAGAPVDVSAILEEFEIKERVIAEDEVRGSGKIFKYHLDYGVLSKNELRRALGFDPVPGGENPPVPVAENTPGRDIGQDALSVVVGLNAMPQRQATIETLRAVWLRGAELAAPSERDEWAMRRVRSYLHLLAHGEPEHPAYTADDDLLPEGHERKRGE